MATRTFNNADNFPADHGYCISLSRGDHDKPVRICPASIAPGSVAVVYATCSEPRRESRLVKDTSERVNWFEHVR